MYIASPVAEAVAGRGERAAGARQAPAPRARALVRGLAPRRAALAAAQERVLPTAHAPLPPARAPNGRGPGKSRHECRFVE